MKNWYILIHFDGYFVDGFIVFSQPDQESARKALIHELVGRKIMLKNRDKSKCYSDELVRLKPLLRSLNHPWRITKRSPDRFVIEYKEFTNEVVRAGYWLSEAVSDKHYCNLMHRPKID